MALGFYFDMASCIGCKTCQTACKDKNDLPMGTLFRRVHSYETGSYPKVQAYHWSASCNHCEEPACVYNCPTGAMYKSEEGPVLHDDTLCIGCQTCVNSCPYSVPQYIEETGKTGKCDSCVAFRENGKNPVCVDACVMRCLEFGDLDELKEKHKDQELVNELPAMPTASMTKPNVRIHPKKCAQEPDFMRIIY